MGLIGGTLGVRLLNVASRQGTVGYPEVATAYLGQSKLEVLMGPDVWNQIRGKTVLDFGCGAGTEAIEMAERGAHRVIGVDLNEELLEVARQEARLHGVADRCTFARETTEHVDLIISLDAFEHFADPDAILRAFAERLAPDGAALISFGPTWYHPLGGHLFSVFPWAHLLFSESALIRWRTLYRDDGARSIAETGLNRMTIRRFRRLVERSPLTFARWETVPIRGLQRYHNPLTREFTTSTVRCALVRRA
jgi:SAM-dependent methyltransferase